MRPSNKSRSRSKSGSNGHSQRRNNMGNIVNRVFESAGPDGKVRGTPQQIIDKYQALARDAQVSGDRVAAESYLQYAEHYSRLLGEAQRQQQESRQQQERDDGGRGDEGGFDGQRRQHNQPVPSGFGMIEPDYTDDMSGPVETPESRRAPADEPAPVVVPISSERQAAPAQAEPETAEAPQASAPDAPAPEQAAPTKRSRPRRRAKAEAPTDEPGDREEAVQASS